VNIKELKQICEKATKGPWVSEHIYGDWGFPFAYDIIRPDCDHRESLQIIGGTVSCTSLPLDDQKRVEHTFNDAAFISQSRTALPEALELIEQQQKGIEALKEGLRKIEWSAKDACNDTCCPACLSVRYSSVHKPDCWLAKLLNENK
jgi:hypothetical protein